MNISHQIPLSRHSQQVAVIEFATTHKLQLDLKATHAALCALLIAQSSSSIISYLMPEKGWVVQTAVLGITLLLFMEMQASINRRMSITNTPSPINEELAIVPYVQNRQSQGTISYAGTIHQAVTDHTLQIFINNQHRMNHWKIIPHPTLFNKE